MNYNSPTLTGEIFSPINSPVNCWCGEFSRLRTLKQPSNFLAGSCAADAGPHQVPRAGRDGRQRRRLQRHHVRLHRAAVDGAEAQQEQVARRHPRLERRRHQIQQVRCIAYSGI